MFSFINYATEIFAVGKTQHVDLGVAFDKFRTDVRLGKAYPYNTGDSLPDFDFTAASEKWHALTEEQQNAAIAEWREYLSR